MLSSSLLLLLTTLPYSSQNEDPAIMVLATILDLSSMYKSTLSQLNDYCSQLSETTINHPAPPSNSQIQVDISIIYKSGTPASFEPSLPNCRDVKFTLQPPKSELPAERVIRLAHLRDIGRNSIQNDALSYKAIALIDLDVASLPSPASVSSSILTISQNKYDVLCAHGYENKPSPWGQYCFYDAYCTQFLDNTWPYTKLNTGSYLNFYLHRMFNNITNQADVENVFGVKYCFGGMAMYSPDLFSVDAVKACSYNLDKQKEPVLDKLSYTKVSE